MEADPKGMRQKHATKDADNGLFDGTIEAAANRRVAFRLLIERCHVGELDCKSQSNRNKGKDEYSLTSHSGEA